MGKINVLSFAVANLIAAGEVVYRPASAVKELVENAIDSGADRITVEIQHGGVTFIGVTDNGCGMEAEDLPVAIRRHATSKIREASDLDGLLIEGAGGITCPLIINKDEKYLLKDLIWELGLSVIIIADAGLGTINSTLLTVDYARANGIEVEGIILNNYESDNFMHWDNLEQIETLTGINVVATVGHNASDIMLLEGLFKE